MNEAVANLQKLLHDPDEELRELAGEDLPSFQDQAATAAKQLADTLIPKHPFEHLPCLIEIRPGAGGSEAALFAGDLVCMYQSYCMNSNLRFKILKYEDEHGTSDPNTSDAPLQEAILEILSENAYGIFRTESGVHRVQRVPETEKNGRVHTSAVSVLVLPSAPEFGAGAGEEDDPDDPSSDFYLDANEVRVDTMRASGKGGQHVNTTSSAVRLTHIPTNTVVAVQDERSQPRNKEKAFRILRSRLAQVKREAREEEQLRLRRSVVGVAKMGRGDKVRTYNWGQSRVTDHRSGVTVHGLQSVIEGGDGLDTVMDSVRAWLKERDMEALIAEEEAKKEK